MNEKLSEALNEISDQHIQEAANTKRIKSMRWIGVIAAVLAAAIVIGVAGNPLLVSVDAVSTADYPRYEWVYRGDEMAAVRETLRDFFGSSMGLTLAGTDGKNQAYSPVNLYMAMCLAAELSGGDDQILSALNAGDLSALRTQANQVWNACYLDDGNQTLLANSLWLDKDLSYDQAIMDTLAQHYYTSVYQGDLGSSGTNRAISAWLDRQTGNMLKKDTRQVSLAPDIVLALYSTVYYQAKWQSEFSAARNTDGTFHGANGDVTATFMNKSQMQAYYYWGEHYGAVSLSLKDGGKMWLVLPDEGKTVEDVLTSGAYLDCVIPQTGKLVEGEDYKYMKVNLSLPKFDIRANGDLKGDLQAMGVTNVFDPLCSSMDTALSGSMPVWLTGVNQATRVAIDEKGITAASYIELPGAGAAMPPEEIIDFILDRPFLFVITNRYSLPLFAGVVNEP